MRMRTRVGLGLSVVMLSGACAGVRPHPVPDLGSLSSATGVQVMQSEQVESTRRTGKSRTAN